MWNVLTHRVLAYRFPGRFDGYPINIPMFYLQWLDRETPMKENIILEYPKGIASVPVANSIVPMWWAEGVAQYQYENASHDAWDSHRDMILRDAALNGHVMSWNDVGHFGHPGIGNEAVADTGYAFASYLAGRYGSGIMRTSPGSPQQTAAFLQPNPGGCHRHERERPLPGFHRSYPARLSNSTAVLRQHLAEGETFFPEGPGTSCHPGLRRRTFRFSFQQGL
ncbi:MAG: hypothetical protein U5N26_08925 [Candidatus Marinimicrobia bacterium]|nr:hypothetical protein [Candidatus Neomarinimicrobiota bacterium]